MFSDLCSGSKCGTDSQDIDTGSEDEEPLPKRRPLRRCRQGHGSEATGGDGGAGSGGGSGRSREATGGKGAGLGRGASRGRGAGRGKGAGYGKGAGRGSHPISAIKYCIIYVE